MSRTSTNFKPAPFLSLLLVPVLSLLILQGCDKFKGDQTIPSYLQIDSIGFTTDYSTEGTSRQKFVDVWVYVDDDVIGGFEMPATIPILAEGNHKLEIRPGIKLNGISDTRAPYSCASPVTYQDFSFVPDNVATVMPTSFYYGNADFVWMEDFEDASLAIHSTTRSDTTIYRTQPAGNPDALIDEYSQFSGVVYLDTQRNFMELVSDDGNGEGFVIDRGDFVFLEINYKTDLPILVGMYISRTDNTVEDRPFVVITASEEWNKIYINFTPVVNETIDATNFKVYLQSQLSGGPDNARQMLDNIKLVTRPNL